MLTRRHLVALLAAVAAWPRHLLASSQTFTPEEGRQIVGLCDFLSVVQRYVPDLEVIHCTSMHDGEEIASWAEGTCPFHPSCGLLLHGQTFECEGELQGDAADFLMLAEKTTWHRAITMLQARA